MSTKLFHSVTPGNQIGDGTVGALTDWLEKMIQLLFPGNGIEYWSHMQGPPGLKRYAEAPLNRSGDKGVKYVASFVSYGVSEGRIIRVCMAIKDASFVELCWIKSFGKPEECWAIAQAITEVLESLIFDEETPDLVQMAELVPRCGSWSYPVAQDKEFRILTSETRLMVETAGGKVIEDRDWSAHGPSTTLYVAGRSRDWQKVLTGMAASYSLHTFELSQQAA